MKNELSLMLKNNRHLCKQMFERDYHFIFDDICEVQIVKEIVNEEYDELSKIVYEFKKESAVLYIEFYGKPSDMGISYKGWKFVSIRSRETDPSH